MGLFDLPLELRLEIYDLIIDTNCDIGLIKEAWRYEAKPTHKYITAWCNMMLVCRQIATELKNHMEENVGGERSKYNTWIVHLSTAFIPDRVPAAMRLPCSPSQLKAVQVTIPWSYEMKRMRSEPYDIDWTLDQLVRFGPHWTNGKVMACPLTFEELVLSFSAPDDAYYSRLPDQYHEEEIVVLAFRRMQKRWSDGNNPLMMAFNKVTVVTEEYKQSWSMSRDDRKNVQGLLGWMVDVCSRRLHNAGDRAPARRTCSP